MAQSLLCGPPVEIWCGSSCTGNEERSADYAERLCKQFSIPDGRLVASLILNTKTHDAGGDADAQVLIDADLAVLGTFGRDGCRSTCERSRSP